MSLWKRKKNLLFTSYDKMEPLFQQKIFFKKIKKKKILKKEKFKKN